MSGICGIAVPNQMKSRVDAGALARMRDTLAHRGPDGAGQLLIVRSALVTGGCLSLIWVAAINRCPTKAARAARPCGSSTTASLQPRELRPHWKRAATGTTAPANTETILHLYEEYGGACVEHLRGMFAFAIWDAPRRRPSAGARPVGYQTALLHAPDQGVLHFASEIKALLTGRVVKPELNYNALADYAANRAPMGHETLFCGVKRLPPGHTLIWEDGRVRIERFWDLSFTKEPERLREDEYVARFGDLFREAGPAAADGRCAAGDVPIRRH